MNNLSDELLVKAYIHANKTNLKVDFVAIIEMEIEKRKLIIVDEEALQKEKF